MKVYLRIFALVISLLLILSCNSSQSVLYKTNSNAVFSSKEEVVAYFHRVNKLEKNRLYFFSDEEDKIDFLLNKTNASVLPYYGLFVNDSTKIIDDYVSDKECIGVVDKFVRGNYNGTNTEYSDLKKYAFTNYLGEALDINKTKSTLVFVINANMGKIINVTANYVTKNIKKSRDSIDYIYLVSDPIIQK